MRANDFYPEAPTPRPISITSTIERRDMVEQVKSCKECTFCFNGNGPVLPVGPTPCDMMILNEAPTRSDDRLGRISHKGEPSLLLRKLLARFGVDLDQVFVANVISCWPDARTSTREMVACNRNVKVQLAACQPKIVLALGAVALKSTSDRKRTITRDHGILFTPRAGPFIGIPVLPTWHPAALKKNPGAETALAADIRAFVDAYHGLVNP